MKIKKIYLIAILIFTHLNGNSQSTPTITGKQITEGKGFYNYAVNFTMTPESVPQTDSLRFQWIRFDNSKIQYEFTGRITKTPNSVEYRFHTYLLGPYDINTYKNSAVYQTNNSNNLECFVKVTTYFKNGTNKTEAFFLNNVNAIIEIYEEYNSNTEIVKIVDIDGRDNYPNYLIKKPGLYLILYSNGFFQKIYIK